MNKICNAADWFDPTMQRILHEEFGQLPRFHRKQWESAKIFETLAESGYLNRETTGLSLGSGTEHVLYVIARHVKKLWATDLYMAHSAWDNARTDNPELFVTSQAPFPLPAHCLSVKTMDMRSIDFPDETFDFAYSSCAIEHIGDYQDFVRHLHEVSRVLKPHGTYVCTTELTYSEATIQQRGNYIFSRHFLEELVHASGLSTAPDFDCTLMQHMANAPLPVELSFAVNPGQGKFHETFLGELCHVQLATANIPFTSCIMTLRKGASRHAGWRFIDWDATAAFVDQGLGKLRSIIEETDLHLHPFAGLPNRKPLRSMQRRACGVETGHHGESQTLFHTEYVWLGTRPRHAQVVLCFTQVPDPDTTIAIRVHRYAAVSPWMLELVQTWHRKALKQWEVWHLEFVPDDNSRYAILAETLSGDLDLAQVFVSIDAASGMQRGVSVSQEMTSHMDTSLSHTERHSTTCKICQHPAMEVFRLPSTKLTGYDIPNAPDDCIYYECTHCQFCFSHILDEVTHAHVYDEQYWTNQDPDWSGRVNQTLRLVLLANTMLGKNPWELEILDFGCGMGTFVQATREQLQMRVWGHDIIQPKFGTDFYLPTLPQKQFDIIVSCEVIEHLPFPLAMMAEALKALKPALPRCCYFLVTLCLSQGEEIL